MSGCTNHYVLNTIEQTDMEWFTQYSNDYVRGNYTKEESNWKRGLPTNGSNNYPDSLDWRSKNAVTPVKNQVICTDVHTHYHTLTSSHLHTISHHQTIIHIHTCIFISTFRGRVELATLLVQ